MLQSSRSGKVATGLTAGHVHAREGGDASVPKPVETKIRT